MPRRNERPRRKRKGNSGPVHHRNYASAVTDCGDRSSSARWTRDWSRVTCDDCKARLAT